MDIPFAHIQPLIEEIAANPPCLQNHHREANHHPHHLLLQNHPMVLTHDSPHHLAVPLILNDSWHHSSMDYDHPIDSYAQQQFTLHLRENVFEMVDMFSVDCHSDSAEVFV